MDPVVSTRYGRLRGETERGVSRFLGIPYAAAPVGERRFQTPRRPEAWDGERPASRIGPTPPCPGYRPPVDQILYQPTIPGEEWLTVNVWTPDPGGSGLPVMVWIHGGAFANGNSAIPMYDGRPFARDGVVLVTLNYRLGVEGFASLRGAPANRGLLDQIAALEWVQENIAGFGGDPGNVTIFGESAGGMSVTTLLAAPRARGLFAKAISQSGAAQAAADPAHAALVSAELGALLGREASAEALRGMDPDVLVAAQRDVSDALTLDPDPARFGATVVASSMAFIPVVDGDLLPEHPLRAIQDGASSGVPLLTGTTSEEFRFFLVPQGIAAAVTMEALTGIAGARGIPPALVDLYRANRPGASAGDVLSALLTDAYFRLPMHAVVGARDEGTSWVYEFAWPSDHFDLRAAHAVDIPFVFDTLGAKGAPGLTGSQPPQKLADEMHSAWVRFASTGDPGWPVYDEQRTVMVFDEAGGREVADPRGDERAAWQPSS